MKKTTRREILGQIMVGGLAAGTAGVLSHEEKVLAETKVAETKKEEVDALSSATRKDTNWSKLSDLKEKIPESTLCQLPMSRVILGGNLVSGFAHARDLLYVSDLVKAYHTKEKTFATFKLAEACGINTFLMNPSLCELVNEYWEKADGTLQFMTNCSGKTSEQILANFKKSIDHEASSVVLQGEAADRLVKEGDFKTITQCVELTRKNEIPVGIAAHRIETLQACVDQGIIPDYWMKTFHHHQYWSAKPGQDEYDNIFCRDPKETIEFMNNRPEPWIAFKVLAAGSIKPQDGFRFAFESGADFICVGMYDFQIVDDINICTNILKSKLNRKRVWQT
ncbi:MAG: hypothetical protein LBC02_09870 [Planctomycetaceae bacterium]|jgi:hypothetical protein|nr:hypothetical protein [Planctomycetaceae bacterium]